MVSSLAFEPLAWRLLVRPYQHEYVPAALAERLHWLMLSGLSLFFGFIIGGGILLSLRCRLLPSGPIVRPLRVAIALLVLFTALPISNLSAGIVHRFVALPYDSGGYPSVLTTSEIIRDWITIPLTLLVVGVSFAVSTMSAVRLLVGVWPTNAWLWASVMALLGLGVGFGETLALAVGSFGFLHSGMSLWGATFGILAAGGIHQLPPRDTVVAN